jgi:hypothetical protein
MPLHRLIAIATLTVLLAITTAIAQTTTTVEKDVPYVPTNERVVQEMLKVAKVTKNDLVYDLGCGDAGS